MWLAVVPRQWFQVQDVPVKKKNDLKKPQTYWWPRLWSIDFSQPLNLNITLRDLNLDTLSVVPFHGDFSSFLAWINWDTKQSNGLFRVVPWFNVCLIPNSSYLAGSLLAFLLPLPGLPELVLLMVTRSNRRQYTWHTSPVKNHLHLQ